MQTRRDLLRWLSTAPLVAPLLARAQLPASRRSPPPGEAALRKNLDASLAALKKVPLTNSDALDVLPRAGARSTFAPRSLR